MKTMNFEEVAQAFQILGLASGAPFAEVKKEYRNLAQVFHPDKYEAGSTRQQWAQDKLIQINNAYELLKDFYASHPDGVIPETESTTTGSANQAREAASDVESDDPVDWRDWEQGSGHSDDMTLAEWEERQIKRQAKLKKQHERDTKSKLILYAKIALVLFVFMLWTGRITSQELQNASARNNWDALKEKQAYELDRGGSNIDGTEWNTWELERRFMDERANLIAQNEARSERTQLTGWCTFIFSLSVIGFIVWGFRSRLLALLSLKKKGGHDAAI